MDILSAVYGTLLNPIETFEQIAGTERFSGRHLLIGLILVLTLSAVGAIYDGANPTADGLALRMIVGALGGTIFWFLSANLFALTAYTFGAGGKPQTILVLTALASLPWLFLPILMLIRPTWEPFTTVITALGALMLWIWASALLLLAIRITYRLSIDRLLLAACIPGMFAVLGIAWTMGLLSSLAQFFI